MEMQNYAWVTSYSLEWIQNGMGQDSLYSPYLRLSYIIEASYELITSIMQWALVGLLGLIEWKTDGYVFR